MRRLTRTASYVLAGIAGLLAALIAYAMWLPPPALTARLVDRVRFIAAEQMKVRADLLDPEGATFRHPHVSMLRRIPILCGEVNEKTAGGGFAGYKRFLSGWMIRLYERDIGRAEMDRAWQSLCDDDEPTNEASP
ncbi:MAG: hypothetical protein ABI777_03490 [Betaproteobacteria bacterium]